MGSIRFTCSVLALLQTARAKSAGRGSAPMLPAGLCGSTRHEKEMTDGSPSRAWKVKTGICLGTSHHDRETVGIEAHSHELSVHQLLYDPRLANSVWPLLSLRPPIQLYILATK
jgi:hypothetical protein